MLTRAITGLFFTITVIALAIYNQSSALILIGIICFFASAEFFLLVFKNFNQIKAYILGGLTTITVLTFCKYGTDISQISNFNLIPLITFYIFPLMYLFDKAKKYPFIFYFVYIPLPLYLLWVYTNNLAGPSGFNGFEIVYLLLLIWANDTFAYLVGKFLGKRKLFESVSPKKTWEGFFGGLFFACIVAYFIANIQMNYSTTLWLLIGAITAIFGTLGDLFESKLKRQANVKDSGNILPGHGGVLDRFDGFLFSLPFVTIILLTIG